MLERHGKARMVQQCCCLRGGARPSMDCAYRTCEGCTRSELKALWCKALVMVLPERIELAGIMQKLKRNKAFGCSCSRFVYHSYVPLSSNKDSIPAFGYPLENLTMDSRSRRTALEKCRPRIRIASAQNRLCL
jgi:hypothetical protein